MNPRSPLRRALALGLALVIATPPAAAQALPDLGDASAAVLSPLDERRIGESVMQEILRDPAYYDDPEITAYIENIGYRLVAAGTSPSQEFRFFLVKDPSVNAFALPGGFVGVHTGLIMTAQNESELASVLAHEIAHVTQHHIARTVAGQRGSQMIALAALAVAVLAARSNTGASQAAMAAAQANSVQTFLDYTREHEREADRIGLQTLDQAGFDPAGMPAFFERLQRAYRHYDSSAPSYMRTHPLTVERISDAQNRVAEMRYRQVADSLEFHLVRAKLKAELEPPREAVTWFETGLADGKYVYEAAQRYGLTLALIRAKDMARAGRELSALMRAAPGNPMVDTLAGRYLATSGRMDEALAQWKGALARHPRYLALIYDYTEALLNAGRAAEALPVLEPRLRLGSSNPRLYLLQARAHAALGHRLEQHRATAEAYVRQGAFGAAVEQLQIALKSGDGDFYQLSSVEARLKEVQRLDREARADKANH